MGEEFESNPPKPRRGERTCHIKLEWVRMVGDMTFIFVGALPIALGVLRSMWKRDVNPPV